jgi:hypothetical protein
MNTVVLSVVCEIPIASEVLMFIMADLNRMFKPEQPHAFSICYGMKGYSV